MRIVHVEVLASDTPKSTAMETAKNLLTRQQVYGVLCV
jgi:hypothetical protein